MDSACHVPEMPILTIEPSETCVSPSGMISWLCLHYLWNTSKLNFPESKPPTKDMSYCLVLVDQLSKRNFQWLSIFYIFSSPLRFFTKWWYCLCVSYGVHADMPRWTHIRGWLAEETYTVYFIWYMECTALGMFRYCFILVVYCLLPMDLSSEL